MPRKTIKSLEDELATSRELREGDRRQRDDLAFRLSNAESRVLEFRTRVQELERDKVYLQKLCADLSAAIRTRS